MIEIRHYLTATGRNLFEEWLDSLRDEQAPARIVVRVNRLAADNFGDCKPLQEGVWELRIPWGAGYRVYYGKTGQMAVLLLCGGDKRKQSADIVRAIACWKDFKKRSDRL